VFTAEDKAFIRAILSSPGELTAWVVYADWLDEHNNPLHAEYLRLMARHGQLRNTELEWYAVEGRLRELRTVLDPRWVAFFDRPKIENCDTVFRFRCPKQWENLKATPDLAVRHCDVCQKKVYYCPTLPTAQAHARQGHCVAVQLGVLRYPDDLKPRVMEDIEDLTEVIGLMEIPEPEPRRPWWIRWKFW
jgi:uncharacterized protein (TIGR02996 family)